MGGNGHVAERVRLLDIIATRRRRLGLVEGQGDLVDREALASHTEVLVTGEPDLLEELVDEQGLLLELLLLLKDQRTELGDARRQVCRGVLGLVVVFSLVHLQYSVMWQGSVGLGHRQRVAVEQPVDLLYRQLQHGFES